MKVKRIVANLEAANPEAVGAFYRDVFGLEVLMDQGWIVTLGSGGSARVQLSLMTEGGSGTPVPDLSIEVDDLEEALARVRAANAPVTYGPVDEPWGVRRFYCRDPLGRLLNVLIHR